MQKITSRKVDELGRIVIPTEMRNSLGISSGITVDITMDGNKVIITSHADSCALCNKQENLKQVNDKFICADCIQKIM